MTPSPGEADGASGAAPLPRPAAAWAVGAGLVGLLWLSVGLRNQLHYAEPGDTWAGALAWAALDAVSFALLAGAIFLFVVRSARRGRGIAWVALGVAVLAMCRLALVWSAANAVYGPLPPWLMVLQAPTNLAVALGLLGILQAVRLYRRQLRRERAALALRAQLSEAELRMLQMQLQPHFLFNALNSVSALMRHDLAAATRVLGDLATLLRISLERTRRDVVTLREEMEFVALYLDIEQTRYQDRLRVRVEVDAAARAFPVPHLILQPLVENAIRHGIAPHPHPADLLVAARMGDDGRLHVEIRDWGAGLPPAGEMREGGLGLAATRARLRQRYGDDAALDIASPEDGGTRVSLTLPPAAIADVDAARAPSPDDASADDAAPVAEGDDAPRGLGWYVRRFAVPYAAFWGALMLAQVAVRVALARAAPVTAAEAFREAGVGLGLWAVVGIAPLLLAARFPARPGAWLRGVMLHAAAGCAALALYTALHRALTDLGQPFSYVLLEDLPFSLQLACAHVGLGHLAFYLEEVRRSEIGAWRLRGRLSEAELRMLQMQVQPGFLLDALGSLSALMRRDVAAADRMLDRLGSLLRLSLERARRDVVTLREEVELLELYLVVAAAGGDGRRVRFDLAPGAGEFPIPPLLLQPLVERAVRRDDGDSSPGDAVVGGYVDSDGRLRVEIRGGAGSDATEAARGDGGAVAGARARLAGRYGRDAAVDADAAGDGGGSVRLVIPRAEGSPAARAGAGNGGS